MDCRQTNNRVSLRWYECQRCGFPYPENQVFIQNGLVVCRGTNTNNCFDKPGYRAALRRLDLPIERPPDPLSQEDEDLG